MYTDKAKVVFFLLKLIIMCFVLNNNTMEIKLIYSGLRLYKYITKCFIFSSQFTRVGYITLSYFS